MSKVITAVFEDGVFKPLQEVQLKEHEKVEIKVLDHDEWDQRFNQIIGKIRNQAEHYSPEDIESDISSAVKESREKKRAP